MNDTRDAVNDSTKDAMETIPRVSLVEGIAGYPDQQLLNDAKDATEAEHNLTLRDALRVYPQAIGWSVLVSTACVMEGYDMAVIGQLFAMKAFQKQFGEPLDGGYQLSAMWQTLLGNAAYVGVIFGILLNGIISERFGLKRTMIGAYVAITAFTFILVFGQNNMLLLLGQLLCGIPWGIFTAAAPTYASEVCPTVLRGYLTTFMNLTWVIGQLISAGVFRGVQGMDGKWAYGIPFAIQWVWPIPLLVGMFYCPDSPWWLLRKGRMDEAERSLRRLSSRSAMDIRKTLAMMAQTDREEKESEGSSYWDCFKGPDKRRTEIGFCAWSIQVFAGISMNQYNTYFFEQAGMSHQTAFDMSIGYFAIGFFGTIISWFLITRFGRRSIFIVGLGTMSLVMFAIAFAALAPSSNNPAMWAQAILLVVWVFLYDVSVGPLAFCIVSEVGSTRLRSKTIAIGRCAFYFWFIIFGIATPYLLNPSELNLKGKTFFVYGSTCFLSAVWSYFRLPEMKNRTYQELDILFKTGFSARKSKDIKIDPYAEPEAVATGSSKT